MSRYSMPHLWPNGTVVVLGTGPSLTSADVEYCRGKAPVIAVNDAYRLAPWADILYAADRRWWQWHKGAPGFAGLKITIGERPLSYPVQVLRNTGIFGLEHLPTGIRAGYNSGYQAIGVAVHTGATRILLLGFDMRGRHFFGEHPNHAVPPFAACLKAFETLVAPLTAAGVSVVNCTPGSALQCFPMATLAESLPIECAA